MDSPMTADEMDNLVPSLLMTSWGNPLIRDSFIGVADHTHSKWPSDVEFVEANGSNNCIRSSSSSSINYSNVSPLHFGYDSSSREDPFSLSSAPVFQYQVGGAVPARVSSWFEQDVDIGSLVNLVDSADSLELWEVTPTVDHHQPPIDKDEILQEIVRECAEIEQRRSSPTISSRDSSTSPPPSSITSPLSNGVAGGKIRKVGRGDRAERKKAQNRMAATRYRQKKRAENEQVGNEMHQLTMHNANLKVQVEDLSYEIDYLKNLMVEIGLTTTS